MKKFIGIDNSSLTHSICIINEDEQKIKEFFIDNNLNGFKYLHSKIKNYQYNSIGFELSHGPLIDYLRKNNFKNIYSLNPLKIKRFKDLNNVSGNKNDKIDAFSIALYLKKYDSFSKPMMFNSKTIEKLNIYRISHDRLIKEHTRYLNKLYFIVSQYFPLFNDLFSTFGCKIMLKMLLKYKNWNELQKASEKDIKNFLILNRYRVNKNINNILNRIKNYNQLISQNVEDGLYIEAKTISEILLTIKQELDVLEIEMKNILDSHRLGKIFKSLPGAGIILSSKLLALFGDNKQKFIKAKDVQCLFGTAPMNYQSGNYHKVIMRKACNKKSRAILYKFAFSSLRLCSWAREYYDNQRAKNKTHSVAIRALSNKWIKIIFSMWKNEQLYNENKFNLNKELKVA